MVDVAIVGQKDIEGGWEVHAQVDGVEFVVTVDRAYWQELTGGAVDVGGLVRRSFAFLLENEPLESILRRFNLREIERYFPQYPAVMRTQRGSGRQGARAAAA